MFELRPFERHHNDIYNPFREFEKDFWNDKFFGNSPLSEFKTDIQDQGNSFLIEADLPGFKKEDIHVDLNGEVMVISAERHSNFEEKDAQGNYVRCERSFGSYQRSFDISGVRAEDISAEYTDGVLKLTLPKKEAALPSSRRLEIA